ncbi:unnamed protein product, partial [Polarella glacialis]
NPLQEGLCSERTACFSLKGACDGVCWTGLTRQSASRLSTRSTRASIPRVAAALMQADLAQMGREDTMRCGTVSDDLRVPRRPVPMGSPMRAPAGSPAGGPSSFHGWEVPPMSLDDDDFVQIN